MNGEQLMHKGPEEDVSCNQAIHSYDHSFNYSCECLQGGSGCPFFWSTQQWNSLIKLGEILQ